jgi:predicted RNase H-like HicB family nuclease
MKKIKKLSSDSEIDFENVNKIIDAVNELHEIVSKDIKQVVNGKYTVEKPGHWECLYHCYPIKVKEEEGFYYHENTISLKREGRHPCVWVEDEPEPENLYTYRIEWSVEDNLYLGYCLEFPSLITHGATRERALKAIDFVVNDSIECMTHNGEELPKPIWDKPEPEEPIDIIATCKHVKFHLIGYQDAESANDIGKVIEYLEGIEERKQAALDMAKICYSWSNHRAELERFIKAI